MLLDEPVEVQDCKEITHWFRGIYGIYHNSMKKTERSKHVTGWTWKLKTLGS